MSAMIETKVALEDLRVGDTVRVEWDLDDGSHIALTGRAEQCWMDALLVAGFSLGGRDIYRLTPDWREAMLVKVDDKMFARLDENSTPWRWILTHKQRGDQGYPVVWFSTDEVAAMGTPTIIIDSEGKLTA